jgi:GH15 family glucan-1,4-alpha-glucosidase
VALDRLVRLIEDGHLPGDPAGFRVERDAVRDAIEAEGFNTELQTYVQVFGGTEVDAALLQLPLYGYVDAKHARMRSTLNRIRRELGTDGLIYRYRATTEDGLPPGEGAFGICGFWAVEVLALAGEVEEATAAFEALLEHANDVGLFAEEYDPGSRAALGNFPQAFTHVGLINAAVTLATLRGQHGAAQAANVQDLKVEDTK